MRQKIDFLSAILIISLVLALVSCKKEEPPKPLNLPVKSAEIISSGNSFGLDLFKRVVASKDLDQNVMVSPLSISLALTMTYNGAESATKEAMEEAMSMTGLSKTEINDLNRQLVNALLAHDSNILLDVANSIWYRNDFTVKPDFININKEYYSAEVTALDFSDPETINVINGWVKDKTHSRIEKIVDQINPESFMFLINAIYFKGPWRYEFDPKKTHDGEFYVSDEEVVPVSMMTQELDLNTHSNDLFSAIELPYGKGNWSMFIFVPNHEKSVDDIIADLDEDSWNQWVNNFTPTKEVNISIPKFTFEFESSLKDVLKDMGMGVAFSSAADFSGILEGGRIQISDVKHKTFVEVNEEGTEAAAVTSVEMELTNAGNYFTANRPFLFIISEKSSNTILFAGKLSNPS